MIVAEHLTKSYDQGHRHVEVLSDLSLRVPAGDFVAITGSSGVGKSTLLQLLGCLDNPSSGRYWLGGREVSRLTEGELARVRNTRIGFIFQTSHFIDYFDLVDNVALHGFYGGEYDETACRGRARELLTRVGLAHRLDHKPAELSGGERQRAAVARALFGSPDLILADEPTGNLDGKNGAVFAELMRTLNEDGITIVMVTHDSGMARIARRRLSLQDGQLEAAA
ncbi:MAG: ABC transporter ATP-binding protein [Gammaproteobacteria bacterium]